MWWWIIGILVVGNVLFLVRLYMNRCKHHWERVETKHYPPACPGPVSFKGVWPDELIKLKQAHTTYVQRCTYCGLERYTTVSVPETRKEG